MEYFRLSNWFFVAHVIIWATALYFFGWMIHSTLVVRRSVRTIRTISESEVRKLTHPIERLDNLFDFCSSSFILVGLIGTITGFFRSLPQLSDANYNFVDLRQALAVSGFGIAWAILLNLALVMYQRFAVSPLVQRLLEKVSVDQLAQSLAESLERFSGQIVGELQKGLSAFAAATTRAGDAASYLAEASKASGAKYQEAMGKAEESAARIHQVFDKIVRLPEATATSLDKSLEVFRSTIQEVLTKARAVSEQASQNQSEVLNEAVNRISSKYNEATNTLIAEQTKFVIEASSQQKRALSELADEHQRLSAARFGNVAAHFQEATQSLLATQKDVMQQSLAAMLETISKAQDAMTGAVAKDNSTFNDALHDVRTEMIHIVDESNRDFAVSLKKEMKSLTASLGEAIAKLTEGAAHLSQSIDRYSATIRPMPRTERGSYDPNTIVAQRNTSTEQSSQSNNATPAASGFFSGMWTRLWRRS